MHHFRLKHALCVTKATPSCPPAAVTVNQQTNGWNYNQIDCTNIAQSLVETVGRYLWWCVFLNAKFPTLTCFMYDFGDSQLSAGGYDKNAAKEWLELQPYWLYEYSAIFSVNGRSIFVMVCIFKCTISDFNMLYMWFRWLPEVRRRLWRERCNRITTRLIVRI